MDRSSETEFVDSSLETGEQQPMSLSTAETADSDYVVTADDTEAKPGERVTVDVEAKALVDDDDAEITGYELLIEYDDENLAFTGAETFLADDDDLDVESNDGSATVELDPSAFEVIGDELIGAATGGDSSVEMDVTIVTLEFAVVGAHGESADIDFEQESTMQSGATALSEYDDDELHWDGATVDIPEADEEDGDGDGDGGDGISDGVQVGELSAVSQGGFVAFDEETESEAESEGVSFPVADDGDTPIELTGAIFDDGTWESTAVSFPTLDAGAADAEVEARDGLSGEIDQESDELTVEGELTVLVDGDEDRQFSFDIEAVTADSGELSGSADFDSSPATVSAVDNEYLVEDRTGDSVVDSSLGLPSTQAGHNWLQLDLEIETEEVDVATGQAAGVVEDESGAPIEGATVEVVDGVGETETDVDGTYELPVEVGTHELRFDSDSHAEKTVEVDVTEAETTERDVTLEAGGAEFDVEIDAEDATAGETLAVTGTVHNAGTGVGSQDVTVSVGDESTTETVDLEGGESETVSLEWVVDEDDVGEYTATVESGDDSASTDVRVDEPTGSADEPNGTEDEHPDGENTFVAHSQGGFISFAEDTDREGALEAGLEFPAQGEDDEHIQIVATIDDDGSWESTSTSFPNLVTDSGIEAEIDAPDGLEGTIDDETGEMTIEGALDVAIEGDDDRQFTFEIATTTGESGSLSGAEAADEDGGAVTVVDNEFLVDDTTGDSIIDSELDLPATDEGTNWFELELETELDVDEETAAEASETDEEASEDEEDEADDGTAGAGSGIVTGIGLVVGLLGVVSVGGLLLAGGIGRLGS
ncbi:carboxypeptidase regulatory-like domain-containing protein [Natronorubrum texcoconense]|uniref:carboxypeptidase regulatory-like domain-containing protein n=1 Tax=Natronorubrum texcoconense TaxID=1095776 RepID=UPI001FDEF86A|nr:carboxypeptidase regulatory-like domain-containing protein [Natronorubrum texcoconense]